MWPRRRASSASTKVESASMFTASMGSIWIATFRPMARSGPSVQLGADALQQRRHGVARGVVVGQRQETLDRRAGGAEIAEVGVQQAGFTPQIGLVGREQQHDLDDFDR